MGGNDCLSERYAPIVCWNPLVEEGFETVSSQYVYSLFGQKPILKYAPTEDNRI